MKDKRHYLSACSINDECIYAFGGFFGSSENEINDSIEVYEVEKNIWTPLTVRMKVSSKGLKFLEPVMGLQCSSDKHFRDYCDWR